MRIVDGGPEDVARIEPLWRAMLAHHVDCAPAAAEFVPFREPAETWSRMGARYAAWLEEPGARLLIAEDEAGRAVGYAFLRVTGGEATLTTGDRVGELQALSIDPEARGGGIGSALLEAAFAHFRGLGLGEMTLSVLDGNDAAQRLYERHGLRPYHLGMIGRIPESPDSSRDAAERT